MVLIVKNETPFAFEQVPMMDARGATVMRAVLKGTYDIGRHGELTPSREQRPVLSQDQLWGDEGTAIKREADLTLPRPYTDLLVVGHACAPEGHVVRGIDVGLMYDGRMLKKLRVYGERRWHDGMLGFRLSEPEPFERMPVSYDRAYGGMDVGGSEPRNRVGRGYVSKLDRSFDGTPAPNVEQLEDLISSPRHRPQPAGLGVIARDWQPRLGFAGTYDEAWQDERFPLLPLDFDARFNQSADPALWIPRPRGGERVVVSALHPTGNLSFQLPDPTVNVGFFYEDAAVLEPMALESVLLDTDTCTVELTWRATADIHGNPFRLLETVISFGEPKRGCGKSDCDGC